LKFRLKKKNRLKELYVDLKKCGSELVSLERSEIDLSMKNQAMPNEKQRRRPLGESNDLPE
tara:strand:- start:4225 stop:4407 length:183 start_codon:yes stop_codon:yes gene_type:complete